MACSSSNEALKRPLQGSVWLEGVHSGLQRLTTAKHRRCQLVRGGGLQGISLPEHSRVRSIRCSQQSAVMLVSWTGAFKPPAVHGGKGTGGSPVASGGCGRRTATQRQHERDGEAAATAAHGPLPPSLHTGPGTTTTPDCPYIQRRNLCAHTAAGTSAQRPSAACAHIGTLAPTSICATAIRSQDMRAPRAAPSLTAPPTVLCSHQLPPPCTPPVSWCRAGSAPPHELPHRRQPRGVPT